MASDENMTVLSSMQEDEYDDTDDGLDQHPHLHSLSRLSVCTSSMYTNEDEEDEEVDGIDGVMTNYMSKLSTESFDADDEDFSDGKGAKSILDISSADDDSEKEQDIFSLPATPHRRSRGGVVDRQVVGDKDHVSENEAQKSQMEEKMRRNLRRRRIVRERWFNGGKGRNREDENPNIISGESDNAGGGGGGGVVVITRPKGGSRSLCMDLEEVKACSDLGFELEHEQMLGMPSRLSLSAPTLESTSSDATSPIANWPISSPG